MIYEQYEESDHVACIIGCKVKSFQAISHCQTNVPMTNSGYPGDMRAFRTLVYTRMTSTKLGTVVSSSPRKLVDQGEK